MVLLSKHVQRVLPVFGIKLFGQISIQWLTVIVWGNPSPRALRATRRESCGPDKEADALHQAGAADGRGVSPRMSQMADLVTVNDI